jgi:hypothetical protein
MIIVIAWTDMSNYRETGEFHRPDGVNWQPVMQAVKTPKACIWLNEGTASDLRKAKAYAQAENKRWPDALHSRLEVFTYLQTESNPLEAARIEVMQ